MSRLKGYLDVLGPNPEGGAAADPYFVLRRALLLRSVLQRSAPTVFAGKALRIDEGVLRALLEVGRYHHGMRSMEAVVAMSTLAGKTKFERSSLPPEHQLALHVDGDEFLALVGRRGGKP